ncbi:MAG: DUF87 domain-containing protein [Clostridiales bacterium]|nr:DUF87 domain-containing protein [Clostridiales bacterium]
MDDLVIDKEKKPLDIREFSELENAFALVDSIVTKNYLSKLDECNLLDRSAQLKVLRLSESASLFRVKKIVYDRNENSLQKLINTYASVAGFNSNVVMIINSNGKEVELYLGTTGANDVSSARGSAKALCNNFVGNFPGSLGAYEDVALDSVPLGSLLNECTKDLYQSVSSVSGVGSPRVKEDVANENYIQGIEKLIDTMQGIPFSAIFIANNVSGDELDDIKAEYELIYSKLIPFLRSDLSFNESSAEGVSKTLSESLSKTVTKSKSSALSTGTSESRAHTEGQAITHTDTVGASVGGDAGPVRVGGHYSHSISRTHNYADTTTFGTTKTQSSTIGDAEAKGEIQSIADGKSLTETTGRTLQISYINKTIQDILDRIDEQLERLKESENYGVFAVAAYFLAADPLASKMAASAYKGLINGNCTHVERANINSWQDEANIKIIKNYLRKLQHPMFAFGKDNIVTPVSVVSGRELAVQMGMPRKSIPGVSVVETAAFGRNIVKDVSKKHRYIELGNLYHMGRDEVGAKGKLPVLLDMDSLTMHTFITGSTGAGKSNAIYTLLEKILERNERSANNENVHFMVIEPAKGEYKDKFGHYKDVNVYGTNQKKMELLRINPFSFPEDVHVLEHIDRLIEIFNVCWPMYAAMPAVLKDAIERSYINAGWDLTASVCKYEDKFGQTLFPSFIDVLKMINAVMEESKYSSDSKGDYTGALCTRIKSLTNGIYGQIFTSNELSSSDLFDSNVIIDLSRVGSVETKSLIMGLLIIKMQEYRMSMHSGNNRGLKHLTILEEAHNLLKKTSSEQNSDSSNLLGKSVEMLANSIAEMRTYGEGFVIADQAPGLLDMSVIRNTNTKIILRLPDISDRELAGRAAALNDNQILELSKLKTGVAAVYQNDWLEPVLCHIHPCKDDEILYEKSNYFRNKNEVDVKAAIIDYVMLPVPKKLELKSDKVAQLEKNIFRLQVAADTKIDLMRYIKEDRPEVAQKLRSRIVYNVFNSESAIMLSNTERYDINSWVNMMLDKLEPNIETFDRVDQDKILAIIASEYADRSKTPEAVEIKDNLLSLIKQHRGMR